MTRPIFRLVMMSTRRGKANTYDINLEQVRTTEVGHSGFRLYFGL